MENSILLTIRKKIGPGVGDIGDFDEQLVTLINTWIASLRQMGIGPSEGFRITGEAETWTDYLGDTLLLDGVKDYLTIKAQLVFDTPQSSYTKEALTDSLSEIEWRLYKEADEADIFEHQQ